MNLTVFKAGATKAVFKGVALSSKHAPKILTALGIGAMAGSVVMACEESATAADILEQHKKDLEEIKEAKEIAEKNPERYHYTDKDEAKELTKKYFKTAMALVRNYKKTFLLFLLGVALITGGQHILSTRNVALAAAYKGLDTSFKSYRKNIIEQYGEEIDYKAAHNFGESIEVNTMDENGVETKQVVKTMNPSDLSIYSILWDDLYSTEWTPNPTTNKMILLGKQKYWTDVLRTRGYVHLDEVYRDLGVWDRIAEDQRKAATAVGWVDGVGDGYVSFGISEDAVGNAAKTDFINGFEPSIILDFNVDGVIHDLL